MARRWLSCIYCGVLVLSYVGSRLLAADEIPVVKFSTRQILARILERQQKVTSARFEWTEQCLEAKGFRHDPAKEIADPDNAARPVTPHANITYSQSQSFSFDGGKTNHVCTQLAFNKAGIPFHRTNRMAFDGLQQLSLSDPTPDFKLPQGRIYQQNAARITFNLLDLEPLLQCYRLGDTRIRGVELDGYAIDLKSSEVDGVPCVVLASASRGRKLWLDPQREFLPLRSTHEVNGVLRRQTDYSYVKDLDHGWVLAGWRIRKHEGQGRQEFSRIATVVDYEINPELGPAEFQIAFPPGTLIDDLRESNKGE